ncbi:MAG: HAD hydrolase family protein [Chthoniobacterales bacterium]
MREIKAVVLDVDGVLTDGTFWWGMDGAEMKRFSFRDVMGISRAMKAGMKFGLISGEENALVDRYAAKLKIGRVWQGCGDKATALRAFAEAEQIGMAQVCFMGDDINDLEAMQLAGFSAAPCDAHEAALAAARYVCKLPGGHGAVRELLGFLLR